MASWSSLDNKSSRQLAATTRTGSSSKKHGEHPPTLRSKNRKNIMFTRFCGRIYMFAIDPISYSFDGKFMSFLIKSLQFLDIQVVVWGTTRPLKAPIQGNKPRINSVVILLQIEVWGYREIMVL